ncbi:uncharacterized protein Z520_00549 [Fonsecaea multimorphosa CBS 102226]|uniref:Uncharacterized protein n=1 Tax=Fonsecaea multimorphosa CBS 102226 TaxID=1442371 RepID=A0A0D2KCI9_9EURO|nr:uncharacterized protein Z520_00549 [Fonsecaea multimorphosa CBS 102226]KIY03858.1 hypothetical protein Z520_00549 [Fonsecaea multimorphosa CBS 102226]OAL32547.1 hypothetical protein AYO22_00569 [Fonsecaea multimorphosa]
MPLLRRTVLGPERRNPCTHMTMTRLYDPYGSFKCSLCHKHPNIGWLYRCTQDTGGFLPESDLIDDPILPRGRPLDRHVTTHPLSSSIVKAIGDGQYPGQEVKKLIEQKEGDKDLVLPQLGPDERRPATASTVTTVSTTSSDGDRTLSTLPQSTTFSTNSSVELDEEIKAAYDWKELQKVWMSEPSVPPPAPRPKPSNPANLPPHARLPYMQPCNFKICPTCRPTYRERAYQSLDEVLNTPIVLPPVWELQNRRVSDAGIVAGIGLPKLSQSRFYAQTDPANLQSFHSMPQIIIEHPETEQENQNVRESYVMGDDAERQQHHDYTHPPSSTRSGFRHTVRKALARARLDDSPPTHSSTNKSESGETQVQPSLSLIFRRRRSRTSTLSFAETHGGRIVDTSSLEDSVMLMLATNTPLPHTPTVAGFQLRQGTGYPRGSGRVNDRGNCLQSAEIFSQT